MSTDREADTPSAACLRASVLLRRLVRRQNSVGPGDQQALLAICGLLDTLGLDLAERPAAAQTPVGRAVLRLADRLQRVADDPAPARPGATR